VEGAVEEELPLGREVLELEEEGRFSSCCREKRAEAMESVGRAAGVVGAGVEVDFLAAGGFELEEEGFETGSRGGISSESQSSFTALPFLLLEDPEAPPFEVEAGGAETDSRIGISSGSESDPTCVPFFLA